MEKSLTISKKDFSTSLLEDRKESRPENQEIRIKKQDKTFEH
ncbi:hypothetical protein [Zunongwangia pacifica]|nr:hypothetical protein [Zunongwangia pacifica]